MRYSAHTMASSDFSSTYMLGVRLVAFPSRPGIQVRAMDETSQVPRKERLHVHKVSDCARFFPCKPVRHGTMLPSLQRNEIGTSEVDPFRSSILGPWSPLSSVDEYSPIVGIEYSLVGIPA